MKQLHLEILSRAQRRLWPELGFLPSDFVLYGGTALALQLGHRKSIDFDFFSSSPLDRTSIESLPFIGKIEILQDAPETFTFLAAGVKFSFFGKITIGRIEDPRVIDHPAIQIASLMDLLSTKLKVIQQRAEKKDYEDIDACLNHGMRLEHGLAGMLALYPTASAMASLKALAFFDDGDLRELPRKIRTDLRACAAKVKKLPKVIRLNEMLCMHSPSSRARSSTSRAASIRCRS